MTASVRGSGYPFPTDAVLLWRSPNGRVKEVVRTGDDVGGRTVATVNLPDIADPGGHRAFNGKEELCFELGFEDGTTGVYIARRRR